MALILADRVRETSTTTGTGALTLAGAVVGYQTFSSAIGNTNTTYYAISNPGVAEWEVGIGTYATSGNTLTRTTIIKSSNSNAAVNFSAGTKDVFVTYPATKSVYLDASANASALGIPASGTVTNLTGTASININGTVGATTPAAGTFTSLSDSGNLTFTGTGNRITGDFSNATLANSVLFQSSVINAASIITAIPNGTSAVSGWRAHNTNDPANSCLFDFFINSSAAQIRTLALGTGTLSPLVMIVGSERLRIDTDGNVGIGNQIPVGKLDVTQTTTNTSALVIAHSGAGGGANVNYGAQINITGASNTNTGVYANAYGATNNYGVRIINPPASATSWALYSDATAQSYFAGNVGIGTSSPSAKLHSYATSGTTTTLGIFEAAIGSYTGTSLIAANTLSASSTYNLFSCITDSDGDAGGPFTQFLVRGDGNVGIGTNAPAYKLEVKGASATAGQLSIHDGTGDTTVDTVTAASLLFQVRDTSIRTIAEIDAVNTTTNGTGGAMVFQTRVSDTLAERMRIDSSGVVTLSTALPVASGGTGLTSIAHTVQVFTSGSGTYTTPANVKAIWVRAVGGGGGAGGSGNAATPTNGTAGGSTTFSTLTATGGAFGPNSLTGGFRGGAGGTPTGGDINARGGSGQTVPGNTSPSLYQAYGGNGGESAFGGSGIAGTNGAGGTGGAGVSGGGGGGVGGDSATFASAGAGAGGYCEKLIAAPSATYSYAVGAGGAGGAAGTGGGTGGAGGAGLIIVTEYYV